MSDVTSAWLPRNVVETFTTFLTNNESSDFGKLKNEILLDFQKNELWTKHVASEQIQGFTSDVWLKITSRLFGAHLIAAATKDRIDCQLEVLPPETALGQQVERQYGYLVDPQHGCKRYFERQKQKLDSSRARLKKPKPLDQKDHSPLLCLVLNLRETVGLSGLVNLRSNLLIAAFHIKMYKKGIMQLPKKQGDVPAWSVLIEELSNKGSTELNALRNDPDLISHYDPADWQIMLHCALAVTPMVLLNDTIPRKISRGVLWQYAMSLAGKTKPKTVQDIESCIWDNMFQLMNGSVLVDDAIDAIYACATYLSQNMSKEDSLFFCLGSTVPPIPEDEPGDSTAAPILQDEPGDSTAAPILQDVPGDSTAAPILQDVPGDSTVAPVPGDNTVLHGDSAIPHIPDDGPPPAYSPPRSKQVVAHERRRRVDRGIVINNHITIQADNLIFGDGSGYSSGAERSSPAAGTSSSVAKSTADQDETEYWTKEQGFWVLLENDPELVNRTSSALFEQVEAVEWGPNQKSFLNPKSLLKLKRGEWINDELIAHFGTTWARQGQRHHVLFLDSYFPSIFMYSDKACTAGSPQLDRQEELNLNLDRRLQSLEMAINEIDFCFIAINERNTHWFSAVIDFRGKEMYMCDSMPEKFRDVRIIAVILVSDVSLAWVCRTILWLQGKYMVEEEWKWVLKDVPKQTDTSSCGLNVLWYLRQLLYTGRISAVETYPGFSLKESMECKRVHLCSCTIMMSLLSELKLDSNKCYTS
ncbi:hypothetical protein BDP27DRAFT_1370852 [Rhodocollybia butyracea]|uniref:Ubiquitin-like protease family profile domain-containing protein n=1 Tax=Rhodocollybia butyracea TaxID=206335 RepID=A0A9P5U034_9AGAR|nr:hypothetical protein BDP27DRAFT_1370852 [Rhodocollybia butyracea]